MSASRRVLAALTVFLIASVVFMTVTSLPALAPRLAAASSATPADAVLASLERARAESSLHIAADIRQLLTPRAVPATLGRGEVQETLRLEGDIVQPGRWAPRDVPRARLALTTGTSPQGVDLLIVGSEAYVGHLGRWKQIEDPLGLSAPGGDYLGFLKAVDEVVEEEPVDTAAGSLRRYTFVIDGERYADQMREHMEQLLKSKLPDGVNLQPNPAYDNMTGSGELWLDAEGRPRREIIDLSMPHATEQYGARSHVEVDFTRYGEEVAPIEAPVATGPGGTLELPTRETSLEGGAGEHALAGADSLRARSLPALPHLPMLPLVTLLAFFPCAVMVRYRRARSMYIAIVFAVIGSMLTAPLLHAHRSMAFRRSMAKSSSFEEALADVGLTPQRDQRDEIELVAERLGTMVAAAESGNKAARLRDCRTLYVDQGVSQTDDEDGDGLTNAEEWCLGTDYTQVDTDHDAITDTLEVAGFDYNGSHWNLDPLSDDSNGDGMADGNEWFPEAQPNSSSSCPDTDHPEDCDGDGVPNAWDDDNDDDGVLDRDDISPFAVYPLRPSVDITVTGAVTTYVDLQIRPQQSSHLRLSTTWLDWPSDSEGQIQDLDASTKDLQLIPVFEVMSPISPTLSSEYGMVVYTDTQKQSYRIWAPLQAVGDAGNTSSFYVRLAFGAQEVAADISLTEGRIRWVAQAQLDSPKDGDGGVTTQPSLVASYVEDLIRVTGLSVLETKDVGVGIFGTSAPEVSSDSGEADEAKTMFNLLSGLSPTFLANEQPSLPTIVDTFEASGALPPYTDTWGVDPSTVYVRYDKYGHRDEALATTTMTVTKAFLNDNYMAGGACSASNAGTMTPTIVTAIQETNASLDAGSSLVTIRNGGSDTNLKPIQFVFPLGKAAQQVVRRVQLTMYDCDLSARSNSYEWQAVLVGDAVSEIHRRYPDDGKADWMGLVDLLFISYYAGRARIISVDGHRLPYIGDVADPDDLSDWMLPAQSTLPRYVREAYHLDSFLADVATLGPTHAFHDWSNQFGHTVIYGRFATIGIVMLFRAFKFLWSWRGAIAWYNYTFNFLAQATSDRRAIVWVGVPGHVYEQVGRDVSIRKTIYYRFWNNVKEGQLADEIRIAQRESGVAEGSLISEEGLATSARRAKIGAAVLAVVVTAAVLIMIWTVYTSHAKSLSGIDKDNMLAQAIASTILVVLQLIVDILLIIFASTGIGFLIEIVLLIVLWVIVTIATCAKKDCDWNPLHTFNYLTKWLAEAILKIGMLADIPDDGVAVGQPHLEVSGASLLNQGSIVSNTYDIKTPFSTTISTGKGKSGWNYIHGRSGNDDDVAKSWAFAMMTKDEDNVPPYTLLYNVANSASPQDSSFDGNAHCDSSVEDAKKQCYNTARISFEVTDAGRDLQFPFVTQVGTYLRYMKCKGLAIYKCSTDMNFYKGPEKPKEGDPKASQEAYDKAKGSLYMDVLPATIDELVVWGAPLSGGDPSSVWNLDKDNDALTDTLESAVGTGTDPTKWDTDGDGLSDGDEYLAKVLWKTDPTKRDTDGDTLDDALELTLGTDASKADSDKDGLTDGEEVCHVDDDGKPVGGWLIRLSGIGQQSGTAKWVCSDPLKSDADLDGILDEQERAAGTSPFAPNKAPGLVLDVDPVATHGDFFATVLEPGDAMTLTLAVDNTTAEPVVRPMTMTYPSEDIGDMTVAGQSAHPPEYLPPSPSAMPGGYMWDFGQAPLLSVEAMTTTLMGSVDSGVQQSLSSSIQVTASYTDVISSTLSVQKITSRTHTVLIDVDDPGTTVGSPADGAAINGESHTISGTANDPTSWPTKVEVSTDGGNAWHTATGSEAWSWDWTLPNDGAYTVKTRATDYVGRVETPGTGIEVVVDNTAPGADFTNLADGDVMTGIRLDRFVIRGTATDLLSGASEVAGLASVQISTDGRPWRSVPGADYVTSPHPQTADWHFVWNVSGERYGDHTLAVRAVDALGQIGEAKVITVTVDTLEPGDILSNAHPDVASSGPVSFLGHVDDEANVPPPARPVSLETGPVQASEVISGATTWLMPDGPTTSTLSAVWLGDVDGDRRADLAVGTPNKMVDGAANAGRVSIVYGHAGGWPVPPDAVAIGDSPSSYVGSPGSKLGENIAPAGDVNGDGLSDFLIGDPLNGQVYLVFGRVTDMGTDQDPQQLRNISHRTRGKIFQVQSGQIGEWLSSAGDVNADGYDDLLIGVTGLGGKSSIYLVLGSASTSGPLAYSQVFTLDNQAGLSKPVVAAVYELEGGSARATGVGDVNGDQYGDIAVLVPNEAVYVIMGGAGLAAQRTPVAVNPADVAAGSVTQGLPDGKHLVALGDVSGDGLPDFGYSSGNVPRIVYGRAAGWSTGMTADVGFSGYQPVPSGFLAGVGDVNDDGLNDLLLGTLSGRAYLVHGRSDLATSQPVAAVLSNAADAASAPYAAGADTNCDDSSDLMLIPMAWGASVGASVEGATGLGVDGEGFAARRVALEAQRPLRTELSLGQAPRPRSLDELPVAVSGGWANATPLENAGLRGAGDGLQSLTATPTMLFVDDDYCETCANDGHTWGTDAFATIQDGVDSATGGYASSAGDTVLIGPGVYRENVVFHYGKDYVTLRGVDPDAVFLDADGGLGIQVFPPSEHGPSRPGIEGVRIEDLTIRNASRSIEVNYGGKPGANEIGDPGNIRLRNIVFIQELAGSAGVVIGNAVNRSSSSVEIQHNTLVADSSSVKLVYNIPAALRSYVYLLDNLFIALPNASPKPGWFIDDNGNMTAVAVNDRNGFAGQTGAGGDWATAPSGNQMKLMKLTEAGFQDVAKSIYRVGADSSAHGHASDGKDLGYYTYHQPAYVDPTYCAKCENDGRTWGVDAFGSVQAAIASGAWKVNLEPGVYRERAYVVNGVKIYGSGAGLTMLAPPDDEDGVLVGAEGVRGAQLALVTLVGDAHDDGLRLDAGADVTLKRSVVRNAKTAVAVDGSDGGATATVVNATLVGNESGVAATNCGNVDVLNTMLAYNTGTALSYQQCATTKLHTYDLYWRNGRDLDDGANDTPTPGEVYADPRFVDPSHNDYRPLPDSPAVDAGDPRSPHPPGTGKHVDIGYVQSVDAAVYVSGDYCQTCLNDGLEWQVDAFATIQEGVDHVPDAEGVWTVGVAPGQYAENLSLRSGVRLVGSGADLTIIDGSASGSVVSIDGATHVELRGFTLQDGGFDTADAGVSVTGASNNVTVTNNVMFSNGSNGAVFSGGSTGAFVFNTVVDNFGTGLLLTDDGTWVQTRFDIFAGNALGIDDSSQGRVFNSYDLFWQNGTDSAGNVMLDETSVYDDPNFVDPSGVFSLMLPSAAADVIAIGDYKPVPLGGGDRADLGYQELLALPVSMMFGKEGSSSCGMGASGVDKLLAAVVKVEDATQSVEDTAPPSPDSDPGSWTTVTISDSGKLPGTNKNAPASYWSWQTTLDGGDGLYRLYTVPTDAAGNASSRSTDWYRSSFVADSASPVVTLAEPESGTTSAPAILLAANVTDTVSTGMGTRDNVARVYFDVDGTVVTATRKAGTPGRYESHAVLTDGSHAIEAVAVDRAGNIGRSSSKSLTVTTSQNEAALVSPVPGTAVTQTTVSLMGFVHFTSTDGDGQVLIGVDGGAAFEAALVDSKAQSSRWTAQVALSGEGSHTLAMKAQRSTAPGEAHETTAGLTLDTVGPSVTIQPQSGTAVFDVTFSGTTSDATSGVATVEVSTDGGYSWSEAALQSGTWTLDWTVPGDTDYARFPVRVRVTDAAGNATIETSTVIADNLGPTPFEMTTLSPAEGTHVIAPAEVSLAWTAPQDGSGSVQMVAAADQVSNTVPSGTPLAANEYTAHLTDAGTWYVHVLARDSAGNETLRHYGPWHAGSSGLVGGTIWQSSIQVDGRMHVTGGEWRVETERMDMDPRPGKAQDLWLAFDEANVYLGWRGARWGIDGTGYVYIDAGPGGSTTPLSGSGAPGLPFEADAAIAISGDGATLYRLARTVWEEAPDGNLLFAYGAHGESETAVPWSALGRSAGQGPLALLAHASVHGAVKSVFPTDNSMRGPWRSAYSWTEVSPRTVPNAEQPEGHHARLKLDSREPRVLPVGPGSTVHYVVAVENLDHEALEGVTLVLTATEGLTFEQLDGGAGPEPGSRWELDLGDLQPGPRVPVEVTARLAGDPAGIQEVTVDATLVAVVEAAEPTLASGSVSHAVDSEGPIVQLYLPTKGATLRSGMHDVRGTASDGDGIGVAYVEVRAGTGEWARADGASGWVAQVEVPSEGTIDIAARAFDALGNEGDVQTVRVAVDNTPPHASVDEIGDVVRTGLLTVSGTARDGEPGGGPIARVEVQLDDGRWQAARVAPTHDTDGSVRWNATLPLEVQEGIPHAVRARAVDQAGNVGVPTEARPFTVDNRPPRSVIDEPVAGATVRDGGRLLIWGHVHDGWGIAQVGVSIDGGLTWHEAKLGAEAVRLLARGSAAPESGPTGQAGPNALYLPTLSKHSKINPGMQWAIQIEAPFGHLALRSRAIDRAGNAEALGLPVRIDHVR